MARLTQRPAARRDLIHHIVYLAEHAGLATAQRFRQAAQQTYEELAEMPQIGTAGKVRQGRFADVRLWRVRGFENYLIFYRPLADGVQIERVIHAAQDYQRILGR